MTHKDLKVYKNSLDLVIMVYEVTKALPASEDYGLRSQMRRAAVSIPSNIAEGSSRGSTKDFIRFINIASGSLSELETQLLVAEKIGYFVDTKEIENAITAIRKMLYRLKQSLTKNLN
jgi:four helix bundle protein